jgi:hypothetical protein
MGDGYRPGRQGHVRPDRGTPIAVDSEGDKSGCPQDGKSVERFPKVKRGSRLLKCQVARRSVGKVYLGFDRKVDKRVCVVHVFADVFNVHLLTLFWEKVVSMEKKRGCTYLVAVVFV